MKKFNNIFEQINVELPAVWKIQIDRNKGFFCFSSN